MVLTPQLRQRIEMLQMTTLELSELIQQEIVANPVLEEVQTEEEFEEISEKILDQNAGGNDESYENRIEKDYSIDGEQAENFTPETQSLNGSNEDNSQDFESEAEDFSVDKSDAFEEVDYGREFQDYLDPGYKTQEIEFKEDAPSFDQFLSRSATLTEHLEWQLNLQQISEALEEAAICVVGNLDEDGRLTASNEEIGEMCGHPVELVEKARRVVMQLEPVGCGARDAGTA
jgi:RNA polymerase sigma-54 factor